MRIALPLIPAGSGNDHYFESLAQSLRKAGVEADVLRFGYELEFASALFGQRARTRLADYDLVHCVADYGCVFQLPDKPFVVTLHHNVLEPGYQKQASIAQRLYHRHLLRRRIQASARAANAIVFGSRHSQGSFASLLASCRTPQHVIYHRINTDYFVPPIRREPGKICRLLFVGNMSRRKGSHLLTPIMQALGPDYQLTCVTRSAGGFVVPENVELRQNVDDTELLGLYQSADILLFPTQLEGFGLTVVEAMSTGLPVVSSDNSSIPELIEQGSGGWLCETDDIADFVGRVERLWGSPAQREAMGLFNRKRAVERYSTLGWAESYLEVYRAAAVGEL